MEWYLTLISSYRNSADWAQLYVPWRRQPNHLTAFLHLGLSARMHRIPFPEAPEGPEGETPRDPPANAGSIRDPQVNRTEPNRDLSSLGS